MNLMLLVFLLSEIKSKVQSGISFESFKETNNRLELIPSDKKNLNSSFISLGRSDQLVGALLKSNVGDILGPVETSSRSWCC